MYPARKDVCTNIYVFTFLNKYIFIYFYSFLNIFYVNIYILPFIKYFSLGGCCLLWFQTVFVVPVVLGVVVVVMGRLASTPRPILPRAAQA